MDLLAKFMYTGHEMGLSFIENNSAVKWGVLKDMCSVYFQSELRQVNACGISSGLLALLMQIYIIWKEIKVLLPSKSIWGIFRVV